MPGRYRRGGHGSATRSIIVATLSTTSAAVSHQTTRSFNGVNPPSERCRMTWRLRFEPTTKKAIPRRPKQIPSVTNGGAETSSRDGTRRPTPTATARAAIPDRHQASKVRSCARYVRRVASSTPGSFMERILPRWPPAGRYWGMAVSEPLRKYVTPVRVVALGGGTQIERADTLATEEPMEIRAHGPGQEAVRVAVTMRTPGGDFELAVGFLFTEGLIRPGAVHQVAYCEDVDTVEQRYNVVTVALSEPFDDTVLHRNFFATSSCGVCGKAALEDVEVRCAPIPLGFTVPMETVLGLPDRLRSSQRVFERTGGLHAAG